MQNIKISELKKHPRNEEFFDDIYGQRWDDFKESVRRRGIVEPIVVTQDLMVVSGHQRVRACEEMGILEIPCRITHYPDYDEQFNRSKEDMILEDLICTNIMQRGVGNVNPMKMAKCIMELERIKGIQHGGDRKSKQDNLTLKSSQSDLAEELNISRQQLQDYKKLTNLIPELQQMIENGSMKATVGYKIWAKMPQGEQEKFFNDIGREKIKTLTQKATQQYIDKIRNLEKELEIEKSKKPEVVVKEIEKIVDNTDYDEINKIRQEKRELQIKCMELKSKVNNTNERELKSEINNLKSLILRKDEELKELEKVKKELSEEKRLVAKFIGENTNLKLISTTSENKKKMMDFLNDMSKYDYLAETFNEIPEATRREWLKGVKGIHKWATNILSIVNKDFESNNIVLTTDFEIN